MMHNRQLFVMCLIAFFLFNQCLYAPLDIEGAEFSDEIDRLLIQQKVEGAVFEIEFITDKKKLEDCFDKLALGEAVLLAPHSDWEVYTFNFLSEEEWAAGELKCLMQQLRKKYDIPHKSPYLFPKEPPTILSLSNLLKVSDDLSKDQQSIETVWHFRRPFLKKRSSDTTILGLMMTVQALPGINCRIQ
jgi:hypothetical protein